MTGILCWVGAVLFFLPALLQLIAPYGTPFNERNLNFSIAGIILAALSTVGTGKPMWFYIAGLLAIIALMVAKVQLRHYNSPLARAIREERRYEQRTLEQFRAEIDRFDEGGGMELV